MEDNTTIIIDKDGLEAEEPKRQIIIFDGDLSTENENFVQLVEYIPLIEGETSIYINSGGGSYACGKILLRELNLQKDLVELVAMDFIGSMAYHVFAGFKGKRTIMHGSGAMLHYIRAKRDIFPSSYDNMEESIFKSCLDDIHDSLQEDTKILTKKEYKEMIGGRDIYIATQRLADYFNCDVI